MSSSAALTSLSGRPPLAGRTVEQQAAYQESVDSARRTYPPEIVEQMDDMGVRGLKAVLGHGECLHIWETSEEYMPMGNPGRLRADLREHILRHIPEPDQAKLREEYQPDLRIYSTLHGRLMHQAIGKMVRLMVVMRYGPAGMGKKGRYRPLDVTTIACAATHALPLLFAVALRKHLRTNLSGQDDQRFLGILDYRDLDELAVNNAAVRTEVNRLQVLADRGVWSDVIRDEDRTSETTAVSGDADRPGPERPTEPHLPLPDDFVSEMGVHCQWVIEQFAPNMFTLAEELIDLWEKTDVPELTSSAVRQRRHYRIPELLTSNVFKDPNGQEIRDLPFRSMQASWWPMRSYRDFVFGMKLVQMAHYFVVGLPLAGRKSELTTLKRDSIEYAPNGGAFVTGRTWKLVERIAGASREFQLPDFSAFALEQQLRLVTLMEQIGSLEPRHTKVLKAGEHLWAEMGTGQSDCRKPLKYAAYALRWFADALGMSTSPSGQGIRVHRFRKTIARLAALAMSDAPKVLMDVFGHRDIETTLHYILTDVDLQSDIERVEREIRVAKATQAVMTIVEEEEANTQKPNAGYGGPHAIILKTAVEVYGAHLHRQGKDWNAETVNDFVQIQTLDGKSWVVVRPGVVCTKFPLTEAGPCNRSRGKPDASRCQSHCQHRLEEPFLRVDVESSIQRCVDGFFSSKSKGADLVQAYWVAQLKIHLPRFSDISGKWKAMPEVQEMLAFDSTEDEDSEVMR